MTDSSSSDHETNSYSMIDRIDRICDQFEKELKCNSNPKIEDYLLLVKAPVRDRLLRDLVALDFEFAQCKGAVEFANYFKRFPESRDVLQGVLKEIELSQQKELELSQQKSRKTPPSGLTGDVTVLAVSLPKFRHFMLLEIAGSGGFGVVWRAMDLRLQREVAMKIPRADRAGRIDLAGITREAQVAAKLRHPNIVSVHEVGEEDGTSFIVTDYINGMNLKEWKKKHSINYFESARLVAKLAMAIQYAHSNGVIHRDLKLANVLMDAKGEPHVADFGLAKREARDDSLAVDGQVLGTPAYMAPEQARADHSSIDRRTDVYSLGVILYELVTGTTPFRGDVSELLQQILEIPPIAPRSIKPDLPKDLEAICLKCLAKENAKRYDSAQALADDLYLFLNGETLRGVPAALPNRLWKWFRRNRRFVATVSIVAFLVASVSSAVVAWRARNTPPTVARWPVRFTTQPPGCKITVVTIDPDTGEPDPARIQSATGSTPLNMSLAGGDYLVVAVFDPPHSSQQHNHHTPQQYNNHSRFHEVYRHVPQPNESVSYGYGYMRWTKLPSGVIEVPLIKIPRPDVSVGMGFCEGTDRIVEPAIPGVQPSRTWRVPSFYVDEHEVSVQDLDAWIAHGLEFLVPEKDAIIGPFATLHYYRTVGLLEAIGKRPPSAAELYYLSNNLCPDSQPENKDKPPCVLNEKNAVSGLHSGVWEWTSTKSGGPFSGSRTISKELGLEGISYIVGCGDHEAAGGLTPTGFKVVQAHLANAGLRGVRSIAPRLTAEDFLSTVKGKPN